MKIKNSFQHPKFSHALLCSGAIVASLSSSAYAQPAMTGTLNADYGSPIALQTINTGFGDSTVGDGTSAGGSELDAAYGTIQGGNLYLFLAGNIEAGSAANHLNVFVSDGGAGQNTLAAPGGSMQPMNGSVFSPGFNAVMALDLNDYQGTTYVSEYQNLGTTPSGGYVGSFSMGANGIGSGSPGGSILYAWNNQNISTMSGPGGSAANQANLAATTTGIAIEVPMSLLGNASSVEVLADVNGGNNGYLSDQFLTGLPVGTGNLGTSTFNFSSTPGEFFTVSEVPEPSILTLVGMGAAGLMARRRK